MSTLTAFNYQRKVGDEIYDEYFIPSRNFIVQFKNEKLLGIFAAIESNSENLNGDVEKIEIEQLWLDDCLRYIDAYNKMIFIKFAIELKRP